MAAPWTLIQQHDAAPSSLSTEEGQIAAVVAAAPIILFALDADGVVTIAEGRALELIGVTSAEVTGRSAYEAFAGSPVILEAVRRVMNGELTNEVVDLGEAVFEVVCTRVDGPIEPGHPWVMGIATDITARHRSEQELAYFAFHDRLTGLANRSLLERTLRTSVERGAGVVALLSLDLDDFKTVNDSLGHAAGDELLRAFAHRLEERIDGAHLLARHGGDEFMLVLEELPGDGRAMAEAVAAALLEEIAVPFRVGDAELTIGASAGISLLPGDATDAAELLKHADAALHEAKRSGRNRAAVYSPEMGGAHRRLELTTHLRAAIAADELELHYQPVFDLATGRVAGAEALARWTHPERGVIAPSEFIPLAEDTGLIEALGAWLLESACRRLREWQDLGLEADLAINASARELCSRGFARRIGERLAAHGVEPHRLSVEITESAVADAAVVAPVLVDLARLGVKVAIDDFGAGFSSLTRLRHLTVHRLKLDRSFLRGVPEDPRAAAFVTAMLSLAGHLGVQVVAEGVETAEQLAFLRREACTLGQGFHLARPLPAAEATALLVADQAGAGAGRGGAPS